MKRFKLPKFNMKKISYGIGSLGIVAVLIGTSVDWSHTSMIFATGSSSVYPLMIEMSDAYDDADVTVSSGGSSNGVSKASEGLTDLGNASRSPNSKEAGTPNKPVEAWKSRKLKTVTLGWDGISIVYKATKKDDQLIINNDNIDKIYTAFAGTKIISMSDLWVDGMSLDWKSSEHEPIIPFARTGGAMVSGTAEAFLKSSRLNTDKLDPEVTSILSGTDNYGANVKEVPEANTQAWGQFVAASDVGSMIYLSTGFVQNNYQDIIDAGYNIAEYQGQKKFDKPTFPFDPDTKEMYVAGSKPDHSYGWYRPFNTIVSVDASQDIKDFVVWMLEYRYDTKGQPANVQAEIMKKMGVVPLTTSQKTSMSYKNKFWVDDYNLITNDPGRDKENLYGAYNMSGGN